MELTLNVLSFNVWGIGIPIICPNRQNRISAIGEELASGRYDIVSLQEVWTENDYNTLQEKTKHVLPYNHYFYSGVIGAGICIFSKYPIIGALFHAWSVNGYFHKIFHADWFGGKGVGLVKILVNNQVINVYNAHLHAEYDTEKDDYKTHRVIQSFDTAQFIENTKGDSVLQILAGDLNTQPDDICYKVILRISKMTDTCQDEDTCTDECPRNTYTPKSLIKKNSKGIRIDHIFIRGNENATVQVLHHGTPLPDRVPGQKFSYSDHEAVLARIKISPGSCQAGAKCGDEGDSLAKSAESQEVLQKAIQLCENSLENLSFDRKFYFTFALIVVFILITFIDQTVPYGYKTVYLIGKLCLFGVAMYFVFMGTFWNMIEKNGILSVKHSMEIKLSAIEKYDLKIDS
ncbi:SMPD2 family protein [Megaselia abdita]